MLSEENEWSRCKAHANLYCSSYTHRDAANGFGMLRCAYSFMYEGGRGAGRETRRRKNERMRTEYRWTGNDTKINGFRYPNMQPFSPWMHFSHSGHSPPESVRTLLRSKFSNRGNEFAIVMAFNLITFSEMQRCASAFGIEAQRKQRRWHFSLRRVFRSHKSYQR